MSRNEAKFKAKRRRKDKLNLKLIIYIFLTVLSYGSHGCAGSRLEHGEHDTHVNGMRLFLVFAFADDFGEQIQWKQRRNFPARDLNKLDKISSDAD